MKSHLEAIWKNAQSLFYDKPRENSETLREVLLDHLRTLLFPDKIEKIGTIEEIQDLWKATSSKQQKEGNVPYLQVSERGWTLNDTTSEIEEDLW